MSRIKKIKIKKARPEGKEGIRHGHADIKEEKRKKTGKIGTAVIAFILVASIIGYMWVSPDEIVEYGKFRFARRDDGWYSKDFRLLFDFHPLDLEDLYIQPEIKEKILNTYMVYFSYGLNETHKEDIARNIFLLQEFLQKTKKIYSSLGSLDENEYELPIINCNNATNEVPVLIFETYNITGIKSEKENKNCIVFKAKNSVDFARLKDRVIYSFLGVMD